MQVNVGLIEYRGPGADDPLVKAQRLQNMLVAIQNPAVAEIDASSLDLNDDDAVALAQVLRCVDACGGKQHHVRVSSTLLVDID